MDADDLPVLGPVLAAGANDRVFDTFLLSGPLLVIAIALLGRTLLTTALAAVYVLGFTLYVLYKGVRHARDGKANT